MFVIAIVGFILYGHYKIWSDFINDCRNSRERARRDEEYLKRERIRIEEARIEREKEKQEALRDKKIKEEKLRKKAIIKTIEKDLEENGFDYLKAEQIEFEHQIYNINNQILELQAKKQNQIKLLKNKFKQLNSAELLCNSLETEIAMLQIKKSSLSSSHLIQKLKLIIEIQKKKENLYNLKLEAQRQREINNKNINFEINAKKEYYNNLIQELKKDLEDYKLKLETMEEPMKIKEIEFQNSKLIEDSKKIYSDIVRKCSKIEDINNMDIAKFIKNSEFLKVLICKSYSFIDEFESVFKHYPINTFWSTMININIDDITTQSRTCSKISSSIYNQNLETYLIQTYYKSIVYDIFLNDAELNKIVVNLINEKMDMTYICDKVLEIYNEFYKTKYKIKITSTVLENVIEFIKNDLKYQDLDAYAKLFELVEKRHESVKDFSKNVYDLLINHRGIPLNTIYNNYIVSQNASFTMFDIINIIDSKDKYINYYKTMINAEKLRIKTIEARKQQKKKQEENKIYLEKEKNRLIKGDMADEVKYKQAQLKKEIEKKLIGLDFSQIKNGYEFEKYVAKLYEKLGYRIEQITKKSGDQGADVVAYNGNEKYVIQAKFYNHSSVGNSAVQEIAAAIGMYKADKGIVVTNSTYTPQAIQLAKANNIELVDGKKIEEFKKIIIKSL